MKKRTWKKRIHQGYCFGKYPDKELKRLKKIYYNHNHGVVFEYGICINCGVYFRVFSARPKRKGVRAIKFVDALEIRYIDIKHPKFE